MKVYDELEVAFWENIAGDPGTELGDGRFWLNTTTNQPRTRVAAANMSVATFGVVGTLGAPTAITAGGGITPTANLFYQTHFIEGSGGDVNVTANPQIAAGDFVGQKIQLKCPTANAVILEDGDGLDLNGTFEGRNGNSIELEWDGTNWNENHRRG